MSSTTPPTLVLASASPRRQDLLARLGVPFVVRFADVDESVRPGEGAEELVRRLALDKAQTALAASPDPDVVVLAADTVVSIDEEILGKPADAVDAARMLRRLSGRTHVVLTGVAVASRQGGPDAGASLLSVEVVATEVRFATVTAADIDAYVATGEPLDKAGACCIQGLGSVFIESINGNYDNVVGLPLPTVRRLLHDAGVCP